MILLLTFTSFLQIVWGEMALGEEAVPQAGYQAATVIPTFSTAKKSDFTFTQPDVMPPR
jgi:hypothetical protein